MIKLFNFYIYQGVFSIVSYTIVQCVKAITFDIKAYNELFGCRPHENIENSSKSRLLRTRCGDAFLILKTTTKSLFFSFGISVRQK